MIPLPKPITKLKDFLKFVVYSHFLSACLVDFMDIFSHLVKQAGKDVSYIGIMLFGFGVTGILPCRAQSH